ncbi:MAG: cytochrome c3 family protein [Acidobacteriota bacterium]
MKYDPGLVLILLATTSASMGAEPRQTSCLKCHGDTDLMDEEMLRIVADFGRGVHAEIGLSCHDCHGGNPDPKLSDDPEAAMDEGFKPHPYKGAPERSAMPGFCGSCHSDPSYMKRFRPDARVDQVREYSTSVHGKRLDQGDTRVATCVDCHGVHGILRVSDRESPVYPTHVAQTCGSCHADSERMAGYKDAAGRPLATDQSARWRRSVHATALLEKEDLSAPTCNDCHGNHGAAPPGLDAVGFVCGQCHGREATLFRASPKHEGFNDHNEFLSEAGEDGCGDCHEPDEPPAKIRKIHSFSECATCHGHHLVVRPTIGLLAPLPGTPCALCHEGTGSLDSRFPELPSKRQNYEAMRDGLLAGAGELGLEGDNLFDWLVEEALNLPTHVQQVAEDGRTTLHPEFARLFTKFRIGKTYSTYVDPESGKSVPVKLVRCTDCHGPAPQLADAAVGLITAQAFLSQMRELTVLTARAERTLLSARRGGVEVRGAGLALNKAVDAQIELEALVHTFSSAKESPFANKQAEGLEHARSALAESRQGLDELHFRRKGLAASLIIIVLVLVSLALKIRHLSETEGPRQHG